MKIFEDNIDVLNNLFGEKEIGQKLERLKFIYKNTEESWYRNLENFKNQDVKFLMICEAPPYSEKHLPIFFYNQINQKLNTIIWKLFFKNDKKPVSELDYYKKLADKGFLLVDNIPFSLNYQSKHRKTKEYKRILEKSLDNVRGKLNHDNIKLAKDVKIAFGFKLNALKFIEVTGGELELKNNRILVFDESHIAATSSGYPNDTKLSAIFFGVNSEFSEYKYYKGEIANPYFKEGHELDFLNPKSLFWYYEKQFHTSKTENNLHRYIENLIRNKLSEYVRDEYKLWEMYFSNSVKK